MVREAIATGETVEQAFENACVQLGVETVEAEFEVLELPEKKKLGLFGGKPAKVRAYIQSSPAQAAADYLQDLLQKMGNPVERNLSFNPIRKGIPRLKDMAPVQRNAMIQNNPDYGVVVCRCEEVSKGEIIDAIHNPLGVATVDSIKRRVRPGMGRCQGGFCMPSVAEILSEELGIPFDQVTQSGEGSEITFGRTKTGGEK